MNKARSLITPSSHLAEVTLAIKMWIMMYQELSSVSCILIEVYSWQKNSLQQRWHITHIRFGKRFHTQRMHSRLLPSYTFCNCRASRHLTCDLVKWDDLMVCVAILNAEAAAHCLTSTQVTCTRSNKFKRECSCALSAKDDLCWLKQPCFISKVHMSANLTKS